MTRVIDLSAQEIDRRVVGLHVNQITEYDWDECYPVVDGDRVVGIIHDEGYRLAGPYDEYEVIWDETRGYYRTLTEMEHVLAHYLQELPTGVEDAAREWENAGFTPTEAGAWLEAGCWDADTARQLADAGITPEEASRPVEVCGYVDTVGYHLSNSDLTLEQALAILAKRNNRRC